MTGTAFVFPGQGSQVPGMGKDLFDQFPEAREVFEQVDSALDAPISSICFDGSEDDLKLTRNTQPAILTVSSAMIAVIRARTSIVPSVVAGHSLGEYSAIVAAEGLEPAVAAKIVRARGTFMQDAVAVGEGAMAALIGPTLEEVEAICNLAAEGDVVSPANINAPGQIVIAGSKTAVERALGVAKERGVRRALMLPVSAPFHCALMKPAEERLTPVLDAADFHDLGIDLVNNVDASAVRSASDVRNGLVRQVVAPVRWVQSVEKMISMGIDRFVEIGPGKVLAGLIGRIDQSVHVENVSDAESLDRFLTSNV